MGRRHWTALALVAIAVAVGGLFWRARPAVAVSTVCPAGRLGERLALGSLQWGSSVAAEVDAGVPLHMVRLDTAGASVDEELATSGLSATALGWVSWHGLGSGAPDARRLASPEVVRAWLDDLRLLGQGLADRGPVLVHIEPGLLDAVHAAGPMPQDVEVALDVAPECADLPRDASGLIPCWAAILVQSAPDVAVAVQVSSRLAGIDFQQTTRRMVIEPHAARTASWLRAAGVEHADLLVFDADIASTQGGLERRLSWARAVSDGVERPHMWWVPRDADVGCLGPSGEVPRLFSDNRLAVARAGAFGVLVAPPGRCDDDEVPTVGDLATALADPTPLCGQAAGWL